MAKINAYHVSLFAYFLDKLKSTRDGDGSLLDHTMYMYGSGMGNPDVHNHTDLPIIVAGGGAGKLKGGRHVKYGEPTPLANLHLTLLDFEAQLLGTRTYELLDASLFKPDSKQGHKVAAKGFIIRESVERINLTALQTVVPQCGP